MSIRGLCCTGISPKFRDDLSVLSLTVKDIAWPLPTGLIFWPETSVGNYQSTLQGRI